MSVALRYYQDNLDRETDYAFAQGYQDVGANSPTGSGKTVFFSHKIQKHNGGSIAVAHRQELVSQISIALARNEVRHRIIGQPQLVRNINALHMLELNKTYYDANARCAVAGVDTLVNLIKKEPNNPLFAGTTLYVQDEAHHCLKLNKWGKARAHFRNAKALHVSATWTRADGMGFGRQYDGFIDVLVHAPSMRELINQGYLTDYRIISVKPDDLDFTGVDIGSTGDFNINQLREATKKSNRLVGDVVKHYLEWAPGKLGVTFAVDVEAATEIAKAFRDAGVPAEVVSANTPDHLRVELLRRFARREILQLVNVDLFGEGFDLPAIEVVSFARATESWALYCQQFGRVLRLMISKELQKIWDSLTVEQRLYHIATSGKPYGMIIDHVGNVLRHMGPPDKRQEFGLEPRERRSSKQSDAIPLRNCVNPACLWPYERVHKCCPFCGHYPEPAARSGPEYVDGDLIELTPEVLAQMRGDITAVDAPGAWHPNQVIRFANEKRQAEKREAQATLRLAMSWWYAFEEARGRPDIEEAYRRFYLTFGIDTATAQTLAPAEAKKLHQKIYDKLLPYGIDVTVNKALA